MWMSMNVMEVFTSLFDFIVIFIIGAVAGIPFPLALLSRRSLEKAWYSYSKFQRLGMSCLHIGLMFAGVALPWLMYRVCRQWANPIGPGDAIVFVFALVATLVVLILRWHLHDSRTWKTP